MSKTPPIPKEQRSFGPRNASGAREVRSDLHGEPGDAGMNLKEQGRAGNLRQNVAATHWKTQDR